MDIAIYELDNNKWVRKSQLDFGILEAGKSFISKTIRFSPISSDIANLKVSLNTNNSFEFKKSEDHLFDIVKNIKPFKIKKGEMSDPVTIEFMAKEGPARLDNIRMQFEYLEIPEI